MWGLLKPERAFIGRRSMMVYLLAKANTGNIISETANVQREGEGTI